MSAFQKFIKNISEWNVITNITVSTGTNSSLSKILLPNFAQIIGTVIKSGNTSNLWKTGLFLSS